MKTTEPIHVLYVDDEESNLSAFKAAFRRDFSVYTANSAAEAKALLATKPIAILITDQRMPKITGAQLLAEAVKIYPNQIRILISAYADGDALINAINEGHIFRFIQKPWQNDVLKETIIAAFKHYQQKVAWHEKEKELSALQQKVEQLYKEALNNKITSDVENRL
jgi:response regulator RpfG family c-di-GMP phosphodiesterase